VVGVALTGCGPRHVATVRPVATPSSTASTTTVRASTTIPAPVPRLVAWNGPVEHLFFHTLVLHPELAFRDDTLGQGFREWFVTSTEFGRILSQLDANGWTLVDLHRVVAGTVRVPAGRRPFVLSVDDVNYYDYSRDRGVGWRLVLDAHGDVKVEDHAYGQVRLSDGDVVPMVDDFVARHPEFSADGAKGVLAVTGYEGVLGERTDETTARDWGASVARASAVAARLRATGWTFASHSWGHLDFTTRPLSTLVRDSERWRREVEPIVGPTDVYVYPFGAQPPLDSPIIAVLRGFGFTIQCGIDIAPREWRTQGVTITERRHVDGVAFDQLASSLRPFFDVASVEDRAARGE
jgi:hypothetical protein